MILAKDMELKAIGIFFLIGKLLSALEGSRQHRNRTLKEGQL